MTASSRISSLIRCWRNFFGSIGIPVPPAPRTDLLPLVVYKAPICPGCGPNDARDRCRLSCVSTPVSADTSCTARSVSECWPGTSVASQRSPANRQRYGIAARAVGGILVDAVKFGTRIGDGVNTNGDAGGQRTSFPYVRMALSGRDSKHIGAGQQGCTGYANGVCPMK